MRRHAPIKRSPTGQRTIAGSKPADVTQLDDRPLAIHLSLDGKHLVVPLPYEVWILSANTLEVERSIQVTAAAPSVVEAAKDGVLWIGGHHLYRGSLYSATATKVGTKLGDFVERVCLLRPGLLAGVGPLGEVLWDIDKEAPVHRRKASEHSVLGLVTAQGRAIWADGSQAAWVIDPEHPTGYMQLKLRTTSRAEVEAEAIVALGTTTTGRCILAARDGAVAWTGRQLRIDGEFMPSLPPRNAEPLAVTGDDRWVYVLRPRGLLQRFLVAQPKPPPGEEDEFVPLPLAEECRLEFAAQCMLLCGTRLVLGGATAEGTLGRLWRVDIPSLAWQPAKLAERTLVEQVPAEPVDLRPNFTPTRSKLVGPPLSELKVDAVLAAATGTEVLATHGHGALAERPVLARAVDELLPGDAVLLPAMVRAREGTARPALLLWPGLADAQREPLEPRWLVWGDHPRGWIPLETPQIREQGWSRSDFFPMQVALAHVPDIVGNRAPLPDRWVDPELFQALARECKKLLKVLW